MCYNLVNLVSVFVYLVLSSVYLGSRIDALLSTVAAEEGNESVWFLNSGITIRVGFSYLQKWRERETMRAYYSFPSI